MTIEIANALFGYLETLYNLNQKLVKLCGIDVIDDFESGEKDILDMIQDVMDDIQQSTLLHHFDMTEKKLEELSLIVEPSPFIFFEKAQLTTAGLNCSLKISKSSFFQSYSFVLQVGEESLY